MSLLEAQSKPASVHMTLVIWPGVKEGLHFEFLSGPVTQGIFKSLAALLQIWGIESQIPLLSKENENHIS